MIEPIRNAVINTNSGDFFMEEFGDDDMIVCSALKLLQIVCEPLNMFVDVNIYSFFGIVMLT